MRIYFAHSIKDYNTDIEDRVVSKLGETFEVENPNQEKHQKAYQIRKMKHFTEDVIPSCEALAYLPLEGNARVGSGVYMEIVTALRRGIVVYRVDRETLEVEALTSFNDRVLSYEDTVKYNNGEIE